MLSQAGFVSFFSPLQVHPPPPPPPTLFLSTFMGWCKLSLQTSACLIQVSILLFHYSLIQWFLETDLGMLCSIGYILLLRLLEPGLQEGTGIRHHAELLPILILCTNRSSGKTRAPFWMWSNRRVKIP